MQLSGFKTWLESHCCHSCPQCLLFLLAGMALVQGKGYLDSWTKIFNNSNLLPENMYWLVTA